MDHFLGFMIFLVSNRPPNLNLQAAQVSRKDMGCFHSISNYEQILNQSNHLIHYLELKNPLVVPLATISLQLLLPFPFGVTLDVRIFQYLYSKIREQYYERCQYCLAQLVPLVLMPLKP